jgi:hypothetical protein
MRDLSAQTGIGTDVNFLNGNLVDDQTLVGEGINQDLVQFFQKLETVVRSFAATTGLKGTVEKALQSESDSGAADKFPDAAAIKASRDAAIDSILGSQIFKLDIGVWDMYVTGTGTNSKFVAYTPPPGKVVLILSVTVRDDTPNFYLPLNHRNETPATAGVVEGSFYHRVTSTPGFLLYSRTGGLFDSIAYDNTGINRGYILFLLVDEVLTP